MVYTLMSEHQKLSPGWEEFQRVSYLIHQANRPDYTFWGDKIVETVKLQGPYDQPHLGRISRPLDDLAKTFLAMSDEFLKGNLEVSLQERVYALDTLQKLKSLYEETDSVKIHANIITRLFIWIREIFNKTQNAEIRAYLNSHASKNFRSFKDDAYKKEFDPSRLPGFFSNPAAKEHCLESIEKRSWRDEDGWLSSSRHERYSVREDALRRHAAAMQTA